MECFLHSREWWCGGVCFCVCHYTQLRNARVHIHIFIYKNSVILYITTPAKSLSTLLPQGLATFGFYTKHMYNLYYTPVFDTSFYGKPGGVFGWTRRKQKENRLLYTHQHTTQSTYSPKALSFVPTLPPHSPFPLSHLSSSPPPILFVYQPSFPFFHVTVTNIYSFYTIVSIFSNIYS